MVESASEHPHSRRGRVVLVVLLLVAVAAAIILIGRPKIAPARSEPLQARIELAAGEVTVAREGAPVRVASGAAVLAGARITAGKGARALLRLSDGSALFLRGGTAVELRADGTALIEGEAWLEVPAVDRKPGVLTLGEVTVSAAESGLSIKRTAGEASVYVARGLAHVTAKGGRAEVHAGERATIKGTAAPVVTPVSYWEDWTGGMADQRLAGGAAGAGRIYGVDFGAPRSAARPLEVTRQAVRVTVHSGIAETEVDQTFFNPGEREVEGWYWLTVPESALVTGFAVENQGKLVEGELIERKEAARQYGEAAAAGYAPALLEWIDGRSYRARIYPVTAGGTRRVVARYLQMLPLADGRLRYHFPMRSEPPVRIGEFSLTVDLGKAGRSMALSTLEDARIENGGERVTMRRSGFTPQADFLLEAQLRELPPPVRVARFSAGAETADFVMLRYVPDMDFAKAPQAPGAVVVVVDTSAGSDDSTRQLEVAAAEAILRALAESDRFALVALDVRPKVLHPASGLAPATETEVGKARELLAAHPPGGATDLGALFDVALARLHGAEQPAVIYIGDGIATSGEIGGARLQAVLRRSLATSRARLYTVAVGGEANHGFLDALAHAGGGRSLRVGTAEEAGSRALELVAALKTPTVTDFEVDAGAGLDEVFTSADGKVSWGGELTLLARSHHDLPRQVKVKGRLGGQVFERSYSVRQEDARVAGLVPRLWATAFMNKILGEVGIADEQRGTLVKLGLDYGLMTPFTSFLALESEQAYAAQGIARKRQPGSPRLVAQTESAEKEEVAEKKAVAKDHRVGRKGGGVFDSLFGRDEAAPAVADRFASAPVAAPAPPQARAEEMPARANPSRSEEGRMGVQHLGAYAKAKNAAVRVKAPAPPPIPDMQVDELISSYGHGPAVGLAGGKRGRPPQLAAPASPPVGAASTISAVVPTACSDTSERPLFERALLWEKRLRTATAPGELCDRYRAATAACELSDWRAEALFLRLLANHIDNEAQVAEVFNFLAPRPEARFYLARVLLRRNAGDALANAIEARLFGTRVAWDKVDLELSAVASLDTRVSRLKDYVARAPDDPAGGMRLVRLLARAGKTDEALLFSRKLKAAGLLTPRLLLALGDLQADAGQTDDAIRTYSEIVEFDPRNQAARRLLGDVFLAHAWYDLSYAQYQTLAEMAPDNLMAQLRLAGAAAGAGRTDEALRIARKVMRAPGAPGPHDPRRFARLTAAALMARLLAQPPKDADPRRLAESMSRDLAELQLFQGPGTLVILSWQDLAADLVLSTRAGGKGEALAGEITDAATAGLSSLLLPAGKRQTLPVQAHLRSAPAAKPLPLVVLTLEHDGRAFKASLKRVELGAGQTDVTI
jgi:Ca-activated chloride channel family protein